MFSLFLVLLLIGTSYIVIYNSKFFVSKFLDRILTYDKLNFSVFNGKVEVDNLKFLTKDNLELFYAKKIIIDLNVFKTIKLSPTISYIYIENPKTFFEKIGENSYKLPNFINTKDNQKKSQGFSFPFAIDNIEIVDGEINLLVKKKFIPIVDNLNVFLPGVDFSKTDKELKPKIHFRIGNQLIKLDGKTTIQKDGTINEFLLELNNFDLTKVLIFIPPINDIQIVSGLATTNLKLKFKSYKDKKPDFIINGNLQTSNLKLMDNHTKIFFIDKINGFAKIKNYNIFQKELLLDSLEISSGKLNLIYSNNEEKKSKVLQKSKGKKSGFKFFSKEILIKNLSTNLIDDINSQNYNFFVTNFKSNDFSNYQNGNINFSLDLTETNIENLKTTGYFNFFDKSIIFDNFFVFGLNLTKLNGIKNKLTNLDYCFLNSFKGNISYIKGIFLLSGYLTLSNMDYTINPLFENHLKFDELNLNIEKFDSLEKILFLKSLSVKNLEFPISKNGTVIKNLDLKFEEKQKSYFINFNKENLEKLSLLTEEIVLNKIKGTYQSKDLNFNFTLGNVLINPKISYDNTNKILTGSADLLIENANLYKDDVPVLKIEKLSTVVDKINYPKSYISFKNIELVSNYATFFIGKDNKIYLFSIFPLFQKKDKTEYSTNINIDLMKFSIKKLNFNDLSLNNPFFIDLSQINCELINYPSEIYPEGSIKINGFINQRNTFNFDFKIGKLTGIKGTFDTKDLYSPIFSSYAEKYLGYKITNGTANINSKYEIKNENLKLNFNIKLNNLKLVKNNKKIIDISEIIPKIEDDDGNINLEIPINGKLDKLNIDYKETFFNVFMDIITNTPRDFLPMFSNFNADSYYDIIYFKAGRDEISNTSEDLFSADMIANFKKKNKYFVIEGYVDKNKDTLVLKNDILKEKIILYNNSIPIENSEEELNILKKIHLSLNIGNIPENTSNTQLKEIILQNITISSSDYYNLSYKRIQKIKEILLNTYSVKEDKIGIEEKNIFENPYIEGIGNSLVILKSGVKKE